MSNQDMRGLLEKARAAQEEYEWAEVRKVWMESGCAYHEVSMDVLDIWGPERWVSWMGWLNHEVPPTTMAERNHRAIHLELYDPERRILRR